MFVKAANQTGSAWCVDVGNRVDVPGSDVPAAQPKGHMDFFFLSLQLLATSDRAPKHADKGVSEGLLLCLGP